MTKADPQTWWRVENFGRLLAWTAAQYRRDAKNAYIRDTRYAGEESNDASRKRFERRRRRGDLRIVKITVRRARS